MFKLLCLLSISASEIGEGVCFAVNSEYSNSAHALPDATGAKRVYLAQVLTGDYATGHDNPNKTGIEFDSVVDNVDTPSTFVIFFDNQAYPNYLITFW